MSSQEAQDRQERPDRQDRPTNNNFRGRGRGRGGTHPSGRGGRGHHKQSSYVYTQYPAHNMYHPGYYSVAGYPMTAPQYAHQMQPQAIPPYPGAPVHQPVRISNSNGEPVNFATYSKPSPEGLSPAIPSQVPHSVSPVVPRPQLNTDTTPKPALVQKAEAKGIGLSFMEQVRLKAEQAKKEKEAASAHEAPKEESNQKATPEPKLETGKPVDVHTKTEPKAEVKAAEQEEPAAQSKVESKAEEVKAEEHKVEELKIDDLKIDTEKKTPQPENTEQKLEPTESETAKVPAYTPPSIGKVEEPKVEKLDSIADSEISDVDHRPDTVSETPETPEPSDSAEAAAAASAASPSPEPVEAENNEFADRVKSATRLASPKEQKYPEGINPNTSEGLIYDVSFLHQFSSVVPAINRKALRQVVNVEAQKGAGRSMSSRSGRPGSSMHRETGRMSRNASMASMHGKGRNNSRRKDRDRQGSSRRDRDEPAAPVAPLVRGENAWVPRTLKVTESGKVESAPQTEPAADLMSAEEVERQVKSLLNKMSLDNLDRISAKIIDIANQSKHEDDGRTLRQVIELTFDKACDEPHWSSMYAKFCLKLHDIDENIRDKNADPSVTGSRLFRRYLLSRCQKEFEKGWSVSNTEDGEAADVMSDAYYAAVKAKRHGLGLVRFLGELFKEGFLSSKIIISCFAKLGSEQPTEEIVESTCKLVTTVAPRLAAERPDVLTSAMETMKAWRTTAGFPARLRFMIMDVEDAHNSGWQVNDDKGPKTLAEVQKEVEHEQMQVEAEKRSKHGGGGARSRRDQEASRARMDRERHRVQQSQQPKRPETPLRASPSDTEAKGERPKNMFTHLEN